MSENVKSLTKTKYIKDIYNYFVNLSKLLFDFTFSVSSSRFNISHLVEDCTKPFRGQEGREKINKERQDTLAANSTHVTVATIPPGKAEGRVSLTTPYSRAVVEGTFDFENEGALVLASPPVAKPGLEVISSSCQWELPGSAVLKLNSAVALDKKAFNCTAVIEKKVCENLTGDCYVVASIPLYEPCKNPTTVQLIYTGSFKGVGKKNKTAKETGLQINEVGEAGLSSPIDTQTANHNVISNKSLIFCSEKLNLTESNVVKLHFLMQTVNPLVVELKNVLSQDNFQASVALTVIKILIIHQKNSTKKESLNQELVSTNQDLVSTFKSQITAENACHGLSNMMMIQVLQPYSSAAIQWVLSTSGTAIKANVKSQDFYAFFNFLYNVFAVKPILKVVLIVVTFGVTSLMTVSILASIEKITHTGVVISYHTAKGVGEIISDVIVILLPCETPKRGYDNFRNLIDHATVG